MSKALSPRQRRVALLMLKGYGDKHIANDLNCSLRTVESEFQKLREFFESPTIKSGGRGAIVVALIKSVPGGSDVLTRLEQLLAHE